MGYTTHTVTIEVRRAAKVAEEIRLIEQHRDFMREHGL